MNFKSLFLFCISLLAVSPAHAADRDYGKIPLSFEANLGQADKSVKFLSRGPAFGFFLTNEEAILRLAEPKPAVVRMKLVGRNERSTVTGVGPLSGRSHYLKGNNPRAWQRDIPSYAQVRYADVYPGIDLVYYGNQRQLEYDFVIAPGSQPDQIQLRFDGIRGLDIDGDGQLVLKTAAGRILQRKPAIYQEGDAGRIPIDGGYVLRGKHRVGFKVAAYDSTKPLIIDPVLVYSTYFGGTGTVDYANAITVDPAGNAYVTGRTTSTDLLVVGGTTGANAGLMDGFILKLDPKGTTVIYSTYFGGSANDEGHSIAIDPAGNAYVTGFTSSPDFPIVNAFQKTRGGSLDAFLLKVNSAGNAIVFSSFLGGSADDQGFGVAVDAAGNAYVTGSTSSTNFPTVSPLQRSIVGGLNDAFVTKVSSGGAVVYSTFVGGIGIDQPLGIAVDPAGNAYVTGYTTSRDFPFINAFQGQFSGGTDDAFLFKVNAAGTALDYSTLIGGEGSDEATRVAVDDAGGAYITGYTGSILFPTVKPHQALPAGDTTNGDLDAFITRFAPDGKSLVFSTFFGGFDKDSGTGIALDRAGNIYVGGYTSSFDLPSVNATQGFIGGNRDAFVSKWTPDGGTVVFASYLGGLDADAAVGLAVDGAGNIYVAGLVSSTNFPIVNAIQAANATAQDAFIAKFNVADIVASSQFQIAQGGGGVSVETTGTRTDAIFGYATADAATPLNGLAVVDHQQSGALVTEVGIPVTPLLEIGRMFVDTIGAARSVISLSNPNDTEASVDFFFTDETGTTSNFANVKIAPRTHFSRFVTDDPLLVPGGVIGALNFTSSLPVASTGFRTFTNEGGEFLLSSTPVVDPLQAGNRPAVIPHFAEGAGWNTQIELVNTTEDRMNGELHFLSPGSGTEPGSPVEVGIAGSFASVLEYDIPPRSARQFQTEGSTTRSDFPFAAQGFSFRTPGSDAVQVNGFAVAENSAPNTKLNGLEILEYHPVATTTSQTAFVAPPLRVNGAVFVEASTSVRTLLAIANTSGEDASVDLTFTDTAGTASAPVTVAVPAGGQTINFLADAPISIASASTGVLQFNSSVPVSVIAVSFLTNEANDSLITAIPVADTSKVSGEPLLIPEFVDGPGLTSDIFLVNPSDEEVRGEVQFFSQGNAAVPGAPIEVAIGESSARAVEYHILARSGQRITTNGASEFLKIGSIHVVPFVGFKTPRAYALLNLKNGTTTVSRNAVEGQLPGTSFRLYAEAFGDFASSKAKSITTAVAFANSSNTAAVIRLSLTSLSGAPIGTSSPVRIPPNGSVAMFLNSVPGFEGLKAPFQGILSVTATSGAVAAVSVRALINESQNFLAATTGPLSSDADDSAKVVFPFVTDGTGYTTQIILTTVTPGQNISGVLRFVAQDASPLQVPELRVGSIQVVPFQGFNTPEAHAVVSKQNSGITIFQTLVEANPPAASLRFYVEQLGDFDAGAAGSTRTTVVLTNPAGAPATVRLDLTGFNGRFVGSSRLIQIPANGHVSMTLNEIPGFESVPVPFQGILRAVATSGAAILGTGMRSKYSERGIVLMTTTGPLDEGASSTHLVFAHIAEGSGYTTQFIVVGASDRGDSGLLQFFNQAGQPLNVTLSDDQ